MKESVIIFAKDLAELMTMEREFYMNHWKGVLVVNGVLIVGMLSYEKIADRIKQKKKDKYKVIDVKVETVYEGDVTEI